MRAGQEPDKELRLLVDAIRHTYEPDHKAKRPGLYGQLQKAGLIIVRDGTRTKKGKKAAAPPTTPTTT